LFIAFVIFYGCPNNTNDDDDDEFIKKKGMEGIYSIQMRLLRFILKKMEGYMARRKKTKPLKVDDAVFL
jgi:hypothetical protein